MNSSSSSPTRNLCSDLILGLTISVPLSMLCHLLAILQSIQDNHLTISHSCCHAVLFWNSLHVGWLYGCCNGHRKLYSRSVIVSCHVWSWVHLQSKYYWCHVMSFLSIMVYAVGFIEVWGPWPSACMLFWKATLKTKGYQIEEEEPEHKIHIVHACWLH